MSNLEVMLHSMDVIAKRINRANYDRIPNDIFRIMANNAYLKMGQDIPWGKLTESDLEIFAIIRSQLLQIESSYRCPMFMNHDLKGFDKMRHLVKITVECDILPETLYKYLKKIYSGEVV